MTPQAVFIAYLGTNLVVLCDVCLRTCSIFFTDEGGANKLAKHAVIHFVRHTLCDNEFSRVKRPTVVTVPELAGTLICQNNKTRHVYWMACFERQVYWAER